MLYLRDFKGTERYKKTSYFVFTDFKENVIGQDEKFLSEITPVLCWKDEKDGGAFIKLAIYDEMPKDYKLFKDAPKAPYGYEWIYNGKPRTNGRSVGLLKIEVLKIPKYKYLEECLDFKSLEEYLPDKSLSHMEYILEAYKKQKLDLVIPRNEKNELVWDGDWDVTILDKNYERIGYETLILKWYEGFEDTGYVIDCFMEDYYNEEQ